MRRLLILAAGLFAALSASHAADVQFVRVWPAWRDATTFARISEYFTGEENTGRETVARTRPQDRSGYYFLTRTDAAATIADAHFVLQVVSPGDPAPKTYTFPVRVPAGSHVFELGLTGEDWPGPKVHPVAWHLELQAADGHAIATKSSFLWEKPAKS